MRLFAALLLVCCNRAENDPTGLDETTDSPTNPTETELPCDIDAASAPWPSWVPEWPGSGRNGSGATTFVMLDDDPAILDLQVVELTAESAVIGWSTAGDADSSIAWGPSPESCPTGYHRTGARREHRMVVAPLEPGVEVHVAVRSSDETSSSSDTLTLTPPAPEAATELDACGEIDAAGSYRLVADVSADCTCFEITADDVTLDLGWHEVTYAEASTTEQCHGVSINAAGAHVSDGIVVQGSAGGDLYSHGVRGYGADEALIERLWIRVHTADANGLRAMYSADLVVRDVLVASEVTQVTDRHYPGNRGIALDLDPSDATGEVSDCFLFGVPHWGIYITADGRLDAAVDTPQTRIIANNHVFADMRATNGYGIGVHANHVEVHHNEIRPLHNGRAMHITRSNHSVHHNIIEAVELIEGSRADGYQEYSDIADDASPHDAGVCSWVVAHGIRVEGGNFGEIYNNEVLTHSLAEVSFGATGLNINVDGSAGSGNEVHHNQFTARQADNSIDCGGGLPMMAGWVRGSGATVPNDLHDNRFVSATDTLVIEDPSLATSSNDEEVVE